MEDSFIFKHIPVSSYFKNKDNNVELSTPYLLEVENCFEISKHIKSATEVLTNVLEPGSVNLCLSSSIGMCWKWIFVLFKPLRAQCLTIPNIPIPVKIEDGE